MNTRNKVITGLAVVGAYTLAYENLAPVSKVTHEQFGIIATAFAAARLDGASYEQAPVSNPSAGNQVLEEAPTEIPAETQAAPTPAPTTAAPAPVNSALTACPEAYFTLDPKTFGNNNETENAAPIPNPEAFPVTCIGKPAAENGEAWSFEDNKVKSTAFVLNPETSPCGDDLRKCADATFTEHVVDMGSGGSNDANNASGQDLGEYVTVINLRLADGSLVEFASD